MSDRVKFEIVPFMETVARSNKLIGHSDTNKRFFRISGVQAMEGLLQNIDQAKFPALLVEDEIEGQLLDNDSDNVMDTRNFMFYIVENSKVLDMADRQAIIDKCDRIRRQILGYLFKLRHEDRLSFYSINGLRNLEHKSVSYFTIGPIGDNCFGIACGFTILDPADCIFKAEDWDFS